MLAYLIILSAALAGLFKASPVVIVAGGLALTAISMFQSRHLMRRAWVTSPEARGFATSTALLSLMNGLIACGAAYALGAIYATAISFTM